MGKHICFNLHKPLKAFGQLFKFEFYCYKMGGSYKKICWHRLEAIAL